MFDLERAKQRAFDRCNLEGTGVDIYRILFSYKAIRELPAEELEAVYDEIAEALGFMRR